MSVRVLITGPNLTRLGGVAQYYANLLPHLGAGVEYFSVGSRTEDEGGIRVLARLLGDYWRFLLRLLKGKYDLIHVNPSLRGKAVLRDGMFLLIAKFLRRPVLVFVHGWDSDFEQTLRGFHGFLFRVIYFRADAFIVLAREFMAHLQTMGYHKAIFVETTVVGDEILDRGSPNIRKASADHRKFNILFLARIEKTKGVYEAIGAYQILKAKYAGVSLVIAGDGQDRAGAQEWVRGIGLTDVSFIGHVVAEEKGTAFENADIYLLPSYSEGMPTTITEAMAYGLPVVTRPVGGVADFFENGRMGFATDSLDPAEFAGLLESLLTNEALRKEISLYNRQYARSNFSASSRAGHLKNIYRTVSNAGVD